MSQLLSPRRLLSVSAFIVTATAQLREWQENQINTTICSWEQSRAAIVHDTVYLNGGYLYWSPGLADGSYGSVVPDSSNNGLIFKYNLSDSFGPHTNVTDLLIRGRTSYAPGGNKDSTSNLATFLDGAALYNNASFFLYGGVPNFPDSLLTGTDEKQVYAYEAYAYGPENPGFTTGFRSANIKADDVSTYVAYGGAASSLSENKAWYFSGLQSPDGGAILQYPTNDSTNATALTHSMVTLDFGMQLDESWTNTTLPSSVKGRANPSVVWVPVGKEGILVIIGGVTYPAWINNGGSFASSNPTASKKESTVFMQTLDIYDIAGDKWYKQETDNAPGTRTRGCAVLGTASDKSSFNIYYYGGFDGLDEEKDYYDDVWVLSMPTFTWTQLSKGRSIHGRSGQQCFTPYPDQMMVFGGYAPYTKSSISCTEDGPLVNYNMSSGEWLDGYDPTKWSEYSVPIKVQSVIGGNGKGGSTKKEPAKGWTTKGLDSVFGTAYGKKLEVFYPYRPASTPTSGPSPPSSDNGSNSKDDGLPSWVAPFLGTILGLIFLTSIGVFWYLFKHHKIFKPRVTEEGTEDTGYRRIWNWVKDPANRSTAESYTGETITDEGPASPEMGQLRTPDVEYTYIASPPTPIDRHEIGNSTQRFEMDGSTPATELQDSPLSAAAIVERHSALSRKQLPHSISDPSNSSLSNAFGDLSSVSHASASGEPAQPAGTTRVDSPTPSSIDNRIASDLPGGADVDAAHLRNITDSSLIGSLGLGREWPALTSRTTSDIQERPETPVSPPTITDTQNRDYLEAQAVSPVRRSVFHEHDEGTRK